MKKIIFILGLALILWACTRNVPYVETDWEKANMTIHKINEVDRQDEEEKDDSILDSQMLDIPTDDETFEWLKEHCKKMPEMKGCEKYK